MLEANFLNSYPTPYKRGPLSQAHKFAQSVGNFETGGAENFGMKESFLSPENNQKIINALSELGFKNIQEKDLSFFYSLPSEEYIKKLSESPFQEDRNSAEFYKKGTIFGFSTTKSRFDGRIRTFIDPKLVNELSAYYGIKPDDILIATAAHELTHKITFDFFPSAELPSAELMADYISIRVAGPEYRFLKNIVRKELNGPFDKGNYELAKTAAQNALIQVLANIDERLAYGAASRLMENPLFILKRAKGDSASPEKGRAIKTVFFETMSRFYNNYVQNLKGAPESSADFINKVMNQFDKNVTAKVHSLVKERRAGFAKL